MLQYNEKQNVKHEVNGFSVKGTMTYYNKDNSYFVFIYYCIVIQYLKMGTQCIIKSAGHDYAVFLIFQLIYLIDASP